MYKPNTLADAYCLTNLQEATLTAVKKKKKNKRVFCGNNSRFSNATIYNNSQKPLLALPNTTSGSGTHKPNTPSNGQNRRLTQKECVEKRAQNLCFCCDKKYVLGCDNCQISG